MPAVAGMAPKKCMIDACGFKARLSVRAVSDGVDGTLSEYLEIDHDFARLARYVIDLDLIAEVALKLL